MSSNNNKSSELRTQIIEEMEARRIDHKTYVDAKWLLNQYDTLKDKAHKAEVEEAVIDAYEHCTIIREREINDLLFEVMEEAQDSFGNGEKVIKNWMRKNNCEISSLLTLLPESEKI